MRWHALRNYISCGVELELTTGKPALDQTKGLSLKRQAVRDRWNTCVDVLIVESSVELESSTNANLIQQSVYLKFATTSGSHLQV